jgi:DNA-binding XRE family transcriptional regulator
MKGDMPVARKRRERIEWGRLELAGARYVVLKEPVFEMLCKKAGVDARPAAATGGGLAPALDLDRASLAEKLVRRRQAAGLSQAELARRAGIRAETLNRIERGHTDPDFSTVRKLVVAMDAAERQHAASQLE